MRTIVSAVHNDGVVGDAQFVNLVEDCTNVLIVIDHGIVIFALPSPGLSQAFRFDMSAKMHVSEIHPDKERFPGLVLFFNKVCRSCCEVIINDLHAFFSQWSGILDILCSIRLGETVDNAPRAEIFQKLRVGWIITVLRFL